MNEKAMHLDPIEANFVMFEDQVSQFSNLHSGNMDMALACEQLYTGELFEERSYEWAVPEQLRLHELYTHFAKQLSRWLLKHQRTESAI
jgi:two-component SAPR family response regulator